MSRNPGCTVYVGNLDEKVTERVLYEIMIQVGRLVDLHIPRDKETNRHKGYAFAEYESEEIAEYAVRLFSGLIRLYNKTLRFAISGQDKSSQNSCTATTCQLNYAPVLAQDAPPRQGTSYSAVSSGISSGDYSASPVYPQVPRNQLTDSAPGTRNNE